LEYNFYFAINFKRAKNKQRIFTQILVCVVIDPGNKLIKKTNILTTIQVEDDVSRKLQGTLIKLQSSPTTAIPTRASTTQTEPKKI